MLMPQKSAGGGLIFSACITSPDHYHASRDHGHDAASSKALCDFSPQQQSRTRLLQGWVDADRIRFSRTRPSALHEDLPPAVSRACSECSQCWGNDGRAAYCKADYFPECSSTLARLTS